MDYSKIETLVNKKFAFVSEFIAASGIAAATYYKMIKNKNTNVDTLEKISRALDVSPAYWWNGDVEEKVTEPKPQYGYVSKRVYDDLMEKWNEDRARMTRQIEYLHKIIERHEIKSEGHGINN
ncbi:MAG: helix-turn-helix domain-containing protein [Bacteroidales bacterium]